MKQIAICFIICLAATLNAAAQFRAAVIGSSTSAGLGATTYDSSWVGRFNQYYKRGLGIVDTVHNLAVSATTVYRGMPSAYTAPSGRPAPDTAKNVTKANTLLAGFGRNGALIVNFPTNGYDTYTIREILDRLQTIYDSAIAAGHRCLVTTSQPRSDGAFASSAVKAKLAAIKDSIINRFGVLNTLNFWDGMYNPADTTILTAYSAGDNVHLNNAGHRELFNRVLAKNIFLANPPQAGDYRSNVSPTGLWSAASSWEMYNGTSWITATTAPDSSAGTVRILLGDSIRVNSALVLDQVVVDTGGVLTFFNTVTPTVFTLSNRPGDDLLVYGRLYVSAGATLTGSGNIAVTPNGLFTLRNFGTLNVAALNDGLARTTGTGIIDGVPFTNNGIFQHVEFTLNLNNGAAFINNDSLVMLSSSDSYFGATSGSGTLQNNAGAILHKAQAAGIGYVNATIAFSNFGTLKGIGQFTIQNILANTGLIAPGIPLGLLSVNPGVLNSKTPVLRLEIGTTGAVAGTNYDQLQLSTVNTLTTNISGTRLELRNTAADPVNTVYTLVSSAGTIAGTFASVSLPSNFGNLTYNTSTVTVEKLAANPLPLEVLRFDARASGQIAELEWELGTGFTTGRTVIERSEDGRSFVPVAEIPLRPQEEVYRYSEPRPGPGDAWYYRLRLQPSGGESLVSAIRALRFGSTAALVSASPNPVGDRLYLDITTGPVRLRLTDDAGRALRQLHLGAGRQSLELSDLAPGLYLLHIEGPGGVEEPLRVLRQ